MGWFGIARLGLVQASIGAIVVLATSTMNRVMVVELSLPALLPGALVALHYTVQILRPRWGYGSDLGGRRAPWIVGGMALLSAGGIAAALSIVVMANHTAAGIVLAIVAFGVIGIGVGAAGTALLALLAQQVAPERRAVAASIVWIMMIAGFVITAGTAGQMLEPFSYWRLVEVTTYAACAVFLITCAAVWRIEPRRTVVRAPRLAVSEPKMSFRMALGEVWNDRRARNFAMFVFVSMLGYSAQELILEPFAGAVFHFSPGESTKLTGLQHSGALFGMILVALVSSLARRDHHSTMRVWTIGGCLLSAAALVSLACAGVVGPTWPLRPSVFILGLANGAFAVAAIGSMMGLAGDGKASEAGVRMGFWGAAQALAFALGGLLATSCIDLGKHLLGSPVLAYAAVFSVEAILFAFAAKQAAGVFERRPGSARLGLPTGAVSV